MTLANQGEKDVIRFNSLRGEEVALTVAFIRSYFCPKATPAEAFHFIRFCQAHQLNPFLRDAYLVKYKEGEPAQMMPGYHVWIQRAASQSDYKGSKQGIMVHSAGSPIERREGAFYGPTEEVVGGWCEVYVEGRLPARIEVAFNEYAQRRNDGQLNRFWKDKPATMIQKVAMGQAFRLAYPSLYAGMYDAAEITEGGDLPPCPVIIDQDARVHLPDYSHSIPPVNRETGEIVEADAELCRECRAAPALDNSAYCGACESLLLGDQQPAMMPVSEQH